MGVRFWSEFLVNPSALVFLNVHFLQETKSPALWLGLGLNLQKITRSLSAPFFRRTALPSGAHPALG